jgi:hypothetical protein
MERQMITTEKVLVFAALIVATSVGAAEVNWNSARAAELETMKRIQAYSAARLDTVFNLVSAMPASTPVTVPMAPKGDLLVPPGCVGLTSEAQSECMDVAFEMDSAPSVVVEIRDGTTTTLLKLDPMTLAVVAGQILR